MAYRDYSTAKGLIVDSTGHGDFTTIQEGINAATAGQVVFVDSGIYTENVLHRPGILLTTFSGASFGEVTLNGKLTCSSAGTYSIANLNLQTNGDYCLEVSGSNLVVVQAESISLSAMNHAAISFTNSNGGCVIAFFEAGGGIGSGNVALYDMTSPGTILFFRTDLQNAGATAPSNNSTGSVLFENCILSSPFSCSSTGSLELSNSRLDTKAENVTAFSSTGTGFGLFSNSYIASGTASALSIGAVSGVAQCVVASTNANAITGTGNLTAGLVTFLNSSTINTSTLNKLTTYGGTIV